MIECNLDKTHAILHVKPDAAFEQSDFQKMAEEVDPFLEAHGELRGLLIEVPKFPGWENFEAMVAHFRFVRDHHKRIEKVAIVTDSVMGDFAQHVGSHFVAAEIKHFPAGEVEAARAWILGGA